MKVKEKPGHFLTEALPDIYVLENIPGSMKQKSAEKQDCSFSDTIHSRQIRQDGHGEGGHQERLQVSWQCPVAESESRHVGDGKQGEDKKEEYGFEDAYFHLLTDFLDSQI